MSAEVKIFSIRTGNAKEGKEVKDTIDDIRSYGSDAARHAANRERIPSSEYAQKHGTFIPDSQRNLNE